MSSCSMWCALMPVIPKNYTLAALRRQREQPENPLTAGIGGVLAGMRQEYRLRPQRHAVRRQKMPT